MDFRHSQDRQMLADMLGRYLSLHYPIDVRHATSGSEPGWSPGHWETFAELGIIGGLFEEAHGGLGGSGFDIAVIFENLGPALVIEPFLPALMAGHALALTHDPGGLLARLIAGEALLAFAHDEPELREGGPAPCSAFVAPDGSYSLTGAKSLVAHAEAATQIIVSATVPGSGGLALLLVQRDAPGVGIRSYPLIDGGRAADIMFDQAPAEMLAADAAMVIEMVTSIGIVALSWEAIGLMDAIKDATLGYLRTRRQFGVPIGKFQALQHRMATLALEIEQARSAAINAAAALDAPRAERERAASAAKYTIGRVGTLVAEEAIQMHGGIGMTWELPLSHQAKRLIMIGHQLGDEDHHLARYITLTKAIQ